MPDALVGLASGEELKKIFAQKLKPYDEKAVAASTREALDLKVAGEVADGWRVLKDNARSTRLAKDKPEDRKLEDDVWCLLYRLGFDNLNAGRQFLVQASATAPARQLDVFAKDDETAIIIECTHARENGAKSVKSLIDKICAIREEAINAVHRHFGRDPKLKVKFGVATRNIDWRKADKDRARDAGIAVLEESDIDYFNKLSGLLKHAARFQFLGRYFRGEKVDGLRTNVPATRGRMAGVTFYSFLISPHDLLKRAYISHRSATSNNDLETYQRMVKASRLKAIGEYIDDGGKFPTNIVVNLKVDGKMNFDLKETFDETATGILSLPAKYGSAWVIDGQHRLYGYAHASRTGADDRSVLTVLAYENLPIQEEVKLFIDINTQQVKVQRNLVEEIISSLDIEDEDPRKRLDAMLARTALQLGRHNQSPIKGRIRTVGQDKSHILCLTLTSISDGIAAQGFLGKAHKGNAAVVPGKLSHLSGDPKLSMDKAVDAISLYLNLFACKLTFHWDLGDAKGGYLCTNNGIRALLQMFRRLLEFVEYKDNFRSETLDAEDLIEKVAPYVEPVIKFFLKEDAKDFRNRGSSLQSVDQNCFQMMALICEDRTDFRPPELVAYMNDRDIEGTKQAKDMIDEMNLIIYEDVIDRLQTQYGLAKDMWWVQGVPKSIRNDCDSRYNENQGERDRWQYLTFANYSDIIVHGINWELFKDNYNFLGKGKKSLLPRWLGRLNKARTITHHAEKGPLSKSEVEFVRKVYELVKIYIEGKEKLVPNKRYLFEETTEEPAVNTE